MLPFLGSALGSSATLDQFDAKQLTSLDHTRYRPLNSELPTLRFFDITSPVRINEIIPQNQIFIIFYASCTSVQILYTSQICIYWIYTQQLNIYTLIFSSLKSFLPTPNLHYPPKSSASVFSLHQSNSSKNWLALMEWRKLYMVMGIHSLIPRASQKIEKYLKFHHPVNLQVDTPRPNIPIPPHFPPHSSINPSDLWEETHKSPKLGQ